MLSSLDYILVKRVHIIKEKYQNDCFGIDFNRKLNIHWYNNVTMKWKYIKELNINNITEEMTIQFIKKWVMKGC